MYFIQTFFVPDEYWQALEVAHNKVFGYGYLTWEWKKCIRSYTYPGLISLLYYLLKWIKLDVVSVVVHGPRILQAFILALGDYCTFLLSFKLFGRGAAKWTLFSIATSWFLHYCAPRTLTNVSEAAFTACGFYLYPWSYHKRSGYCWSYLWLAGLSCMMRPTAAVTWLPLYLWHGWRIRPRLAVLLLRTLLVGLSIVAAMMMIDHYYFDSWVFTPYQFFTFNWKNDIGAFYGSHSWHWYFTTGYPTVMCVHLLPLACGLKQKKLGPMYSLIFWVIVVLSQLSHKEFRFLLPIMHLSMIVVGVTLQEMTRKGIKLGSIVLGHKTAFTIASLTLVVELLITGYAGLYHQRGVLDAMDFLSKSASDDIDILYLMPCHSTPYYSHVHQNISMRFLTCEPNFEIRENYLDEADVFYQDPNKWLRDNYVTNPLVNDYNGKTVRLPTHIVMYDSMYSVISEFLLSHRYKLCFSAFHAHFTSGRASKFVQIHCKY